jgi:hypothetical protein
MKSIPQIGLSHNFLGAWYTISRLILDALAVSIGSSGRSSLAILDSETKVDASYLPQLAAG